MTRFWRLCWAILGMGLVALPATASTPPAFTVGDDLYIMGLESHAGELVPILHNTTDIRRNLRANRCGVVRVNRLEELRLGLGSEVVVNGRRYGAVTLTPALITDSLPQCQQDGTLTPSTPAPLATLADETVYGLDLIQTLAIPGFQPGERVEIHYHRHILAYHRVNGCGYIHDDADGATQPNQMTLKLPTGDRPITVSGLPTLAHAPLCRANGDGWAYYPPPNP